ncbi:viral a-type inclusion protein [Niveomyces insectorum RCEF 264]|uniref:Viral a-type inclusion protein n=1 Tax=Niveomyces insectorum RCEF 264 TaxID=1081102 RepID=A0A167M987_9HYPO|nr:viral a-type inclusion protein [Niveomyces insectorum RCEF 264]
MDIDKRSEKIFEFDLKYLEARHQEALIAKDEDTRRQKVRAALLQEENALLKDQVSQLDGHINQLSSRVTQDSTKILAEKLALSREVAVLKPEVEHLRSQISHQKDVLTEKLALERQLNALEVELANEKRATQRAAQRQASREKEVEDSLRQQVQDLEGKLASGGGSSEQVHERLKELEKALGDEKRESQRIKKAMETELSEARGQIEILEQRIGDLKAKLRAVRDELRSACAELAAAQEKSTDAKVAGTDATKRAKTTAASKVAAQRKRRTADEPSGPELMLQTPDVANDGRTKRLPKKRGFDPALVTQKSAFSITPFLNKTMSNPMEEDGHEAASKVIGNKPKTSDAEKPASLNTFSSKQTEESTENTPDDLPMEAHNPVAQPMPSADVFGLNTAEGDNPTESDATGSHRGRPNKKKVLSEVPASKTNTRVPPPEDKATGVSNPPLTKKSAETTSSGLFSEQENKPPTETAATAEEPTKSSSGTASRAKAITGAASVAATGRSVAEPETRKKKRKILKPTGERLFNEDDDNEEQEENDALSRPRKAAAIAPTASISGAAAKRPVKALGSARAAVAGTGKRSVLGGARSAFGKAGGGFSPLKRDRRGVNASFLA